jgi:hypothetical protein
MTGPLAKKEHEEFCNLIAQGVGKSEAYREVGYKGTPSTIAASATNLLKKTSIRQRIAELSKPVFDQYQITTDRIQREMALSGFARMVDYADLLDTGDLRALDSERSAALTELTRETTDGGITRTKIKLGDKHQSLVALAKIHGLMKDGGGEPVQVIFNVHRTERSRKQP